MLSSFSSSLIRNIWKLMLPQNNPFWIFWWNRRAKNWMKIRELGNPAKIFLIIADSTACALVIVKFRGCYTFEDGEIHVPEKTCFRNRCFRNKLNFFRNVWFWKTWFRNKFFRNAYFRNMCWSNTCSRNICIRNACLRKICSRNTLFQK